MATTQSTCKRPKLSLTIKPSSSPKSRSSRSMSAVDPQSPTAFNTLSNVYVTAIERSTPVTAINTFHQHSHDTQTPRILSFPQTPLSANTTSPTPMELAFPSILTSTPPLSAGPTEPSDPSDPQRFTFPKADVPRLSLVTNPDQPKPRTPQRRVTISSPLASQFNPPYTHPRSLHSILRNSPLPPRSVRTPMSPRRQSLRFQQKTTRRVAYHSPLEQTIITNKYTKSHIDLLSEDPSPNSPAIPSTCQGADMVLDLTLAFTGDETRDGGQTPGPFEEMRRRMAGLAATSPLSPSASGGIRKRKRKEKMRHWAWTIGRDDEEEEDEEGVSGAIAATRAAEARAASEPPPGVTHLVEIQDRMEHSGDEDSLYN